MEKENFRVLLDLSDLQDRVYKFVWLLVSTIDLKNIADLKNTIINKLDLDTTNGIKLFLNGGLLLDEEKIIILRENDTVQIKYETFPNAFCHNSSLMEAQDRKLSLKAEKSIGNKVSKQKSSKKHKRRSEGIDLPVDEEYQKLTQNETFLDQILSDQENTLNHLKDNSSCMEVDGQRLSLNAEKCNGNEILKHSKKHKSKSETRDLPIAKVQNILLRCETLPDSSICNSSYVEDNKSSINAENCNGNKNLKHSKNHKRRNEGDSLNVVEENNVSKKKRKKDADSLDSFDDNGPMLKHLFAEKNISSPKKNKSISGSTIREITVSNESNNNVEINNVPVVSDVSVSCKKHDDTINLEVNEGNKPTDVSVDSFAHGSNCKKRKRKRKRKRKADANLLGPFMSANTSFFQNFTEDDSKALSPCDDYAGVRKHIRFTSPDRESIAKTIETVEPEMNHSSSQSEGSPIKSSIPPSLRSPSFIENVARATEIAKKVNSKFCTSPNSSCSSISIIKPIMNQSKNRLEPTNNISQNTSSKTYNATGCINLSSPKPMLNSTNNMEALAEQILVDRVPASTSEDPPKNSVPSYTDYPLIKVSPSMGTHIAFKLLELGDNYSPEVSNYKEGVIKSLNPHSEELEIELINIEIRPGRTGKFENLKEDEDPQEEVIKKVMVPWSSLIEPRLISQNSSK